MRIIPLSNPPRPQPHPHSGPFDKRGHIPARTQQHTKTHQRRIQKTGNSTKNFCTIPNPQPPRHKCARIHTSTNIHANVHSYPNIRCVNLHILLSQTHTPSTHTHKCTHCVCLLVFLSHTVEVCFPHTEEICKHVSPTSVYLRPRSIPTWRPKSAYLRPRSIANL